MANLGFVGLGVMGGNMVARLLDKGHKVCGYNRTRSKAQWLIDRGMKWGDSPRAVSAAADFTFSMVTNAAAINSITEGPDGILAGMVHAMGWEKYQQEENPYLFTMPERTLEALAAEVAKKLGSPVVRVVGEPGMKVTRIAFSPGAAGFVRETHALEMENVEVLLVGETREWETVEYAADAVSEGKRKALIVIGHVPSEQAGMEECARWLKMFVKDVPIEFVPTKQPFWTVADRGNGN